MKLSTNVRWCFIALLIISISGCQATRRGLNFETSAAVNLSAAAEVNPDMDGRASPIVIRVFKLTDARQFQREDFLNLYENAQQRLGNDLIDVIVLKELVPGEARQELIPLTPDVRYLGFMAEYMQYQKSSPIVVVPIKDHNKNKIQVIADQLQLVDPNQPASYRQGNSRYKTTQDTISQIDDERRYWERQNKALQD
ncbi:MAG: type VI secretion system lipoprotein TssJ [Cellvibrionaceae bacterium]|nr:type VI secretion system lipoprotein TssJ [Cellvibrionaceae bacterium]